MKNIFRDILRAYPTEFAKGLKVDVRAEGPNIQGLGD